MHYACNVQVINLIKTIDSYILNERWRAHIDSHYL